MPVSLDTYHARQSLRAHPEAASIAEDWPGEERPEVDTELGMLLDEGIVALNFLVRAYRLKIKDFLARLLDGLASLPFALMYTLWDISQTDNLAFGAGCLKRDDIEMVDRGMFLLHAGIGYRIEPPDFETTAKIVGLASPALRGNPHPFFAAMDVLRNSVSREREGDSNGAIIESVTGIEMFVRSFIRVDMSHRGTSQDKISEIMKSGFRNLLSDHFARPLEVDFNPKNPENALETWFTSAYRLRNDVVHEGKLATSTEARRVLAESDGLVTLIREAMNENPQRWSHIRPLL